MTKLPRFVHWAGTALFAVMAGIGTADASNLRAQEGASLSGTATASTGQPMPNTSVQLRDLRTGQLAATTTTSATGSFSFEGVRAGQYVVEIVSGTGQVIGTSAPIGVAAGSAVTGVSVAETGALAPAAASSTASGGAWNLKTAMVVTSIAAAAAVVTAVVVTGSASPSR